MARDGDLPPLKVGLSVFFQNPGRRRPDADVYRDELRLAALAEPLGFDSVWTTEHHFTDYMMAPDPLQFLTFMAGSTRHVLLGSMVVVLPWHDPLRVAEGVVALDHFSGGRVILGLGRGAATVEFEGFRVPMGESRERFVEAARMILDALESGTISGNGPYYPQPACDLRPAPRATFRGRTYAATLSPESVDVLARLRLGIQIIPQKPWTQVAEELARYREVYRAMHAEDPPAPIASTWVYCDRDHARAEEMSRRYMADYYKSTIAHYRFDSQHFAETKDYGYYARIQKHLERSGADELANGFVALQAWGTPGECAAKIRDIQEKVGCGHVTAGFSYAGMPIEDAERSLRLFAAEVIPRLRQHG